MNLTDFSLCGISVTDAVLQHLTGLKNLTYLDLDYCNTSEATFFFHARAGRERGAGGASCLQVVATRHCTFKFTRHAEFRERNTHSPRYSWCLSHGSLQRIDKCNNNHLLGVCASPLHLELGLPVQGWLQCSSLGLRAVYCTYRTYTPEAEAKNTKRGVVQGS